MSERRSVRMREAKERASKSTGDGERSSSFAFMPSYDKLLPIL
jgi:hypothetical protein